MKISLCILSLVASVEGFAPNAVSYRQHSARSSTAVEEQQKVSAESPAESPMPEQQPEAPLVQAHPASAPKAAPQASYQSNWWQPWESWTPEMNVYGSRSKRHQWHDETNMHEYYNLACVGGAGAKIPAKKAKAPKTPAVLSMQSDWVMPVAHVQRKNPPVPAYPKPSLVAQKELEDKELWGNVVAAFHHPDISYSRTNQLNVVTYEEALSWNDDLQNTLIRAVQKHRVQVTESVSFILWNILAESTAELNDYPVSLHQTKLGDDQPYHELPLLNEYQFGEDGGDYLVGKVRSDGYWDDVTTGKLISNAMKTNALGYVGTKTPEGILYYELGTTREETSSVDTVGAGEEKPKVYYT